MLSSREIRVVFQNYKENFYVIAMFNSSLCAIKYVSEVDDDKFIVYILLFLTLIISNLI